MYEKCRALMELLEQYEAMVEELNTDNEPLEEVDMGA